MDPSSVRTEREKIAAHITENAETTLRIVINKECTLRCRWCYKEGLEHEKKKPELSTRTFRRAIRAAYDAGFRKVNFTGGEPLMFPELIDVVEQADSLGMKSYVTTNGTVLAGIDWDRWKKLRHNEFHVTLNAIDSDDFSDICGQDLAANVLKGVDFLLEHKIPMKFNTVVSSDEDWPRIAKILDYVAGKKVAVKLLGVHDAGSVSPMSQADVARMVVKRGGEHVRTSEGVDNNFGYDQYSINGALVHVLNMVYGGGCCDRFKNGLCGEGIRYPRLVYNGEIKPCLHVTTSKISDESKKEEIIEKLYDAKMYIRGLSKHPYKIESYRHGGNT